MDTNENEEKKQSDDFTDEKAVNEARWSEEKRVHSCGCLFHASSAPPYMLDNAHIRTGYRPILSYYGCVKSLFRLHNETINIWTHLLASIDTFYTLYKYNTSPPTPYVRGPQEILLWGSGATFVLSTIAHTFSALGSKEADLLWAVDRAGICLYVSSGILAAGRCHFRYNERFRFGLYQLLTLVCTIVAMRRVYYLKTDNDKTSAALPIGILSMLGFIPMIREMYLSKNPSVRSFVPSAYLRSFFVLGLGALLFSTKFPERIKADPNSRLRYLMDFFGNSHSMMHVCVWVAAKLSFFAIRKWSFRKYHAEKMLRVL